MSSSAQARWAKLVEQWGDSELSCREFAQRHGVNPNTLSWWKWRLNRAGGVGSQGRSGSSRVLEFVELSTVATAWGGMRRAGGSDGAERAEGEERLELRVGSYWVGIPCGFELRTLERVLDVLERRGRA